MREVIFGSDKGQCKVESLNKQPCLKLQHSLLRDFPKIEENDKII